MQDTITLINDAAQTMESVSNISGTMDAGGIVETAEVRSLFGVDRADVTTPAHTAGMTSKTDIIATMSAAGPWTPVKSEL